MNTPKTNSIAAIKSLAKYHGFSMYPNHEGFGFILDRGPKVKIYLEVNEWEPTLWCRAECFYDVGGGKEKMVIGGFSALRRFFHMWMSHVNFLSVA